MLLSVLKKKGYFAASLSQQNLMKTGNFSFFFSKRAGVTLGA